MSLSWHMPLSLVLTIAKTSEIIRNKVPFDLLSKSVKIIYSCVISGLRCAMMTGDLNYAVDTLYITGNHHKTGVNVG